MFRHSFSSKSEGNSDNSVLKSIMTGLALIVLVIGGVIVFSDLSGSAKDGSSRQELSAAVDKQDPIIGVWHSEAGAELTVKDDGTAIMKQELSSIEIEGSWQKIDGEKYNIELVYMDKGVLTFKESAIVYLADNDTLVVDDGKSYFYRVKN